MEASTIASCLVYREHHMLPKLVHTYQHHHLDSARWAHFTPATTTSSSRPPTNRAPPGRRRSCCIHAFWRDWISRGWFEWEHEGYPYWGNMHHLQAWWDYRELDNILLVHFAD